MFAPKLLTVLAIASLAVVVSSSPTPPSGGVGGSMLKRSKSKRAPEPFSFCGGGDGKNGKGGGGGCFSNDKNQPPPPGPGPEGYGEPGYGEPGYGQPGYGEPGYGEPGWGNGQHWKRDDIDNDDVQVKRTADGGLSMRVKGMASPVKRWGGGYGGGQPCQVCRGPQCESGGQVSQLNQDSPDSLGDGTRHVRVVGSHATLENGAPPNSQEVFRIDSVNGFQSGHEWYYLNGQDGCQTDLPFPDPVGVVHVFRRGY